MDDSCNILNFDLGKKNEIHHHSQKEHVTITVVKLRNLVKRGKYSPAKFANFVLISITRGKMHHFRPKCGAFSRA
jgi:hypothetical protein